MEKVIVKKRDGVKIFRDELGYKIPDGDSEVVRNTHISRALKNGDLVLVNNKKTGVKK